MARKPFQLFYITDRAQLETPLEEKIAQAIDAGVDWIQIREKDLTARQLLALAERAASHARRAGTTRVVVNDRIDVALAANAHGVHLTARSMPVAEARRMVPEGFMIGKSCHSLVDAQAAESAGADYILLGPIFPTPSKDPYGPPLGLATLGEVTAKVSIPVFGLGGISLENAAECLAQGAAGVAGIRLFQEAVSISELVSSLHATS
jgi:thiamine-phosphate pyrophosphorylase